VIEWSRIVRDVFYLDGSLRDIYVLGTSEHDWQAMLAYLRVSPYPLEYLVDGEMRPLPEHVAEIFALTEDHFVVLQIDRARLGLKCHFFTPQQIECDLDPKDFQDEQYVSSLLDFMRSIGRAVNKPIILTGENVAERPLFRYNPATNEETWFLEENWG